MTTTARLAQAAYESGRRAMNAGHPDVAARLMREGLAQLGWRQRAAGRPVTSPSSIRPSLPGCL